MVAGLADTAPGVKLSTRSRSALASASENVPPPRLLLKPLLWITKLAASKPTMPLVVRAISQL